MNKPTPRAGLKTGIIILVCLAGFMAGALSIKRALDNQIEIGYSFEVPVLEGSTHIKLDDKRINLTGFKYFYSWSGADNRSVEIQFQDGVLTCRKTRLTMRWIGDPHYFYLSVEYLKKVEYGFIILDKVDLEGVLYAE